MGWLTGEELGFARAIVRLNGMNPFLPARLECEREALGAEFEPEADSFWGQTSGQVDRRRPNLLKLSARATQVANRLREQLDQGAAASADELALYDGLVTYLLFYDLYPCWGPGGEGLGDVDGATDARAWRIFEDRFQHWHRRAGRA
ncbi:MAG: hypothetical protein ACKOFW_14135, partial [Planctomycetaceae bacterium]